MRDRIRFRPKLQGVHQLTEDSLLFDGPRATYGRFRIVHQIGAGSVGPVFRGEDSETRRPVVVKVIRVGLTPERVAIVGSALRVLASSLPTHPALCPILETGIVDVEPFVVSPIVDGDSLDVALREYGPANMADAVPRLRALADALDAVAAVGVAHGSLHLRDVVVSVEHTMLTGIGIAAVLERVGVRPPVRRPYCAPEVALGGAISPSADQYSLAAIAHELLCGRRVVVGEAPRVPTSSPEGAEALAALFGQALAVDPADRFSSATAFVEALADVAGLVTPRLRTPRRKAEVAAPLLEFDSAEDLPRTGVSTPDPSLRPALDSTLSAATPAEEPVDAAGPAAVEVHVEEASDVDPIGVAIRARHWEEPLAVRGERPASAETDEAPSGPGATTENRPSAFHHGLLDSAAVGAGPATPGEVTRQGEVATADVDVAPDDGTAHDEADGGGADDDLEAVVADDSPSELANGVGDSVLPFQYRDEVTDVPVPAESHDEPRAGMARATLGAVIALGAVLVLLGGRMALRWLTPAMPGAQTPRITASASTADAPSQPAVPAAVPPPRAPTPAASTVVGPSPPPSAGAPTTAVTPSPAPERAGPSGTGSASRQAPQPASVSPSPPSTGPRGSAGASRPSAAPAPRPARATAPVARPGRLLVRSTPSGAEVYVNGARRGVSPVTIRDLALGAHTVRVSRTGFAPAERRVVLEGARPARTLEVSLTRAGAPAAAAPTPPSTSPGSLLFESRPSGARVFVDGTDVGRTPASVPTATAGEHAVRIELSGYLPITTTARVQPGVRTRVAVTLTSERPRP